MYVNFKYKQLFVLSTTVSSDKVKATSLSAGRPPIRRKQTTLKTGGFCKNTCSDMKDLLVGRQISIVGTLGDNYLIGDKPGGGELFQDATIEAVGHDVHIFEDRT